MKKRWVVAPRQHSNLLDQLLERSGIVDHDAFLNPRYDRLHDPHGLLHADQLVERIVKAIETQEPIAIFGDYDHDGTPAAALLADGIRACGGNVQAVIIPSRDDGYGLSMASIDQIAETGATLMITVDCGITNKPEIDYATERGITSLVIDHHVVQDDKYPDKAIVVNPKQKGDTYPFKELCACGLAFKVIQLLGEKTSKITNHKMKWYLDLVAISTVCDMVPLIDENRVLVHYGLMVLRKTKRLGLQKLLATAEVDLSTISTYTVGFIIGPRLNAPGRMEKASVAYDLLVSTDEEEATKLAIKLQSLNRKRQELLETTLKEAEAMVLRDQLQHKKIILVSGEGWNDGIVGLVAGRLMERYGRPTIVLSIHEDGLAKGSARSIDGFHLVEALQDCEKWLVKYGGHAKAAGLTLRKDSLTKFYDKLIEIAEGKLTDELLQPKLTIDMTIAAATVTTKLAKELTKLEPYGLSNPRPIFMVESVKVTSVRTIGSDGKHLKLKLTNDRSEIEAVAFGMASRSEECRVGLVLDVAGFIDVNEWQSRQSVQLKLIDMRLSEVK